MHQALPLLERLAAKHAIAFSRARLPQDNRFETRSGLRLRLLDWPDDGEPLLLLHGGALTAHTWDLVCLELSEFRCVALDLRGHGESEWAQDYSIGANVGDVADLLAHLELGRVHIAGMSLGGTVAGHFAAAFPQAIATLTFVDVGPGVDFDATARMRAFVENAGPVETVEALVDAAIAISAHGDRDTIHYRYFRGLKPSPSGLVWKHDQRRPRDYARILAQVDDLARLASAVSCPVLVARGGRSQVFSAAAAKAFATRFAQGRWTVIPDAGHNVQEDNPKALARALRAHLAGARALSV